MNKHIQLLIESIFNKNASLNEAFESSTIKMFFNKVNDILKNENKNNLLIGIWMKDYFYCNYINNQESFKSFAKHVGLSNFKDDFLWKGNEKYQNETGIYNNDEIKRNLGINTKPYIYTDKSSIDSIVKYCAKVPTAFLGIVKQDTKGCVDNFLCGMFIDPTKGDNFLNYIKEHNKKKDERKDNEKNTALNFDFSLENAIKTNENIQTYLKSASNEQKELLKNIVNETQKGDNKYLADITNWMNTDTFNYLKTEIIKAIKNEGNDKNKKQSTISIDDLKNIKINEFTKIEAKNKLKLFRYNVINLLCQPKEDVLKESYWYKRLNDNIKKYILNTYQLLHKDLKQLSNEDKQTIKTQISKDWKNIITNNKRG